MKTCTHYVVREAMRIVAPQVRLPKCVRDGLVKPKKNMNEKDFAPYEQAIALKELGFDEPCFGYYVGLGDNKEEPFKLVEIQSEKGQFEWIDNVYHAPTFSQAFRWFRKKGYDVKVQKESDGLYFGFYWTGAAWIIVGNGSHEKAELECLIKLIEIVKAK